MRHIFATLHRLFKSAVIDELIESNPVVVEKGVLPKNVDKDPSWRATAVFERAEVIALISDQRISRVRRMLNALKALAAVRHGLIAGATAASSRSPLVDARTSKRPRPRKRSDHGR